MSMDFGFNKIPVEIFILVLLVNCAEMYGKNLMS